MTATWPILAAVILSAPATVQSDARSAIAAVMADSAAGWNAGDEARFMAIYAEDAVYMSGTTLVRGRAAIARRYAATFAGGANTRGRLDFAPLEWRPAGPRHMLHVARWTLTPAAGAPESGLTTLLFEQQGATWRVVADHSS